MMGNPRGTSNLSEPNLPLFRLLDFQAFPDLAAA
jgi:hypothetical protein